MIFLACADGGLICGPVLVILVSSVLGWFGYRRATTTATTEHDHNACEHDH